MRRVQREDDMKREWRRDGHLQTKGRGLEEILPSPQKEPALTIPGFWTSRLQNSEIINFYCLAHTWHLVMAALAKLLSMESLPVSG